MNSNELKNIIENARIAKGISQRELAKLSGISRSTLNDIINGKIKKVDVDSLKKIAETLDLSLTNLLKVAGYDEFLDYLSLDKYKNKSTKDLKEMIEKHKESELDLLDFDAQKRKKVFKLQGYINNVKTEIRIISAEGVRRMTDEELLHNLDEMYEITKEIAKKYDYSKLPKDF